MTTTMRRLAAVVAGCVLAGACAQGDPVSVAGNEEGTALLFTGTSSDPSPVLPSGSADVRISLELDPTVLDAFNRRPTTATVTGCGSVNFPQFGRSWSCLNVAWRWTSDLIRTAAPAKIDPRFPHPVESGAGFSGSIFNFFSPVGLGGDYWNGFGTITGLKPNTQYQVVFAQYRLKVAGALDHSQRILQGTVTIPDTLVLAAGTPGATNTNWTGAAPVGCAPFPGANTNPFAWATLTTNAAGDLAFDKCWQSGNGIWTQAEHGQQAKSMVGRNDNTAYSLPNYNYFEVWETGYGVRSGPAMRIQIAQDLTPGGAPIPNAYAPFPAPNTTLATSDQQGPATVDRNTAFPISYATSVALPSTFGFPDSTIVTLTNVEALETGVYKVWLVNPTTGAAKPATGRWIRRVGTDTVASGTGTATFDGGPGTIVFRTRPYGEIGAPDISDSLSVLMVTIEADASATTPSSAQPFWTTVIKKLNATVGGALTFGEFTLDDASRGPERFIPQGKMAGGVIGNLRDSTFVGSVIELQFTGLMRPPIGYRYRGYLCESDDTNCSPTDPTTSYLDLGGLTSPTGQSLDDADTAANDANLSSTLIVRARLSASVTGAQTLCDFDRFRLMLEPKTGEGPPLARIFDALLPAKVRSATECR